MTQIDKQKQTETVQKIAPGKRKSTSRWLIVVFAGLLLVVFVVVAALYNKETPSNGVITSESYSELLKDKSYTDALDGIKQKIDAGDSAGAKKLYVEADEKYKLVNQANVDLQYLRFLVANIQIPIKDYYSQQQAINELRSVFGDSKTTESYFNVTSAQADEFEVQLKTLQGFQGGAGE